jgi:hypothetical protein
MSSPISSSLDPTGRSSKPVGRRARQAGRGSAFSSAVRGPWVRTATRLARLALGGLLLASVMVALGPRAHADDLNDYPTSVRSDYVFGCMKANGETREILEKCSCSIDVIASIIPYDRYVTVETILSMSQVTGPVGSEFRQTEAARLALQEFRRAQAEAEVRCF